MSQRQPSQRSLGSSRGATSLSAGSAAEDEEEEEDLLPEGYYDPMDGFGMLVNKLEGHQPERRLFVRVTVALDIDGQTVPLDGCTPWQTPAVGMGQELGRMDWEDRYEWTGIDFSPEQNDESQSRIRLLLEVVERGGGTADELEEPVGWCSLCPFEWINDESESFPAICVTEHKLNLYKHQDGKPAGTTGMGAAMLTCRIYDPFDPPPFVALQRPVSRPPVAAECWLKGMKKPLATTPYAKDQGFDLYIDMARFLPDNVSASKITIYILASNSRVLFGPVERMCVMTRSCYHPVFALRLEIRDTELDSTATLLIQMDTIDEDKQTVFVVGYATCQLFATADSDEQPTVETANGYRLSSGHFQLPLHTEGIESTSVVSQPYWSILLNDPCLAGASRKLGVKATCALCIDTREDSRSCANPK